MIVQQPDLELGPGQPGGAGTCRSRRAPRSRATASASIGSDLPRSRAWPRRASPISCGETRITVSPCASKKRSRPPETCRQSSSAHTRLIRKRTRPSHQLAEALLARAAPCARRAPWPRTHRRPPRCAWPCADRSRSRSSKPSPSVDPSTKRTSGGQTSVGARSHAPIKSRSSVLNRRSLTHRYQANPGNPGAAVTRSESSDRRTGPSTNARRTTLAAQ